MTSVITYLGSLRTKAVHLRSQTELISDAPIDNQGKGESFSPTDTVATGLASCMLTIMGIKANQHDWDIKGTTASVNKIMASNPRRISTIEIHIKVPSSVREEARGRLEKAALSCPVAMSLHPAIEQKVSFSYE